MIERMWHFFYRDAVRFFKRDAALLLSRRGAFFKRDAALLLSRRGTSFIATRHATSLQEQGHPSVNVEPL